MHNGQPELSIKIVGILVQDDQLSLFDAHISAGQSFKSPRTPDKTYVCPIQVGKWCEYEGDPCCLYIHIIDVHQDFGKVCWKCWTPTALEELQHPTVIPGTICRGRENFEDLYRAVPYLVWQIRALRKPVFKLLGLKRYVDCFTSTIDWCHWLAHPATETLPDLTNLVSSFAYAYLYSLGRLPSDSLEIDNIENDSPLFTAIQD
ncbi:hypothetical protein K435DRAFT_877408 [Dendrothele bispora CBS 962.96]|uniref:Uncharacterized protein n=1 Tax=Dendrothele bispora (strain CBS 962.96) TaxID=1314807 RepID=A0A4S8KQ72_DENBC|nr:hypothetical protein K435DRAFT_877408 [Dendrothele bispora CBS 962.96]